MLNGYFIKLILGCIACVMFAMDLQAQKKFFEKLAPHHVKTQYAGGIGFVSLGLGYSNRKQNFDVDFYYGYVPERIGGVAIHSTTAKFTWSFLKTIKKENFFVKPLTGGLLINYSFGNQYFGFDPEKYSFRYYWFPTSIQAALLVGSHGGIDLPDARVFKKITVYYEILSFDRELISYITNSTSLQLSDILTLGAGVKFSF